MKPFFVIGTDTNCGKTYVTCQLLNFFKQQQKKTLALKPVATGCVTKNGKLENEDVIHLQEHNSDSSYQINRWLFAPPISPHIAAKQVNCSITIAELAEFCLHDQYSRFDHLLIEGAGGLMAPLNEEETWLDFLKLTKIPVILVVGMRLGCINHALLTDAVLKQNKISCVGWVANCLDERMQALQENITTLTKKMHMPHLAMIPFNGAFLPINYSPTVKASCL